MAKAWTMWGAAALAWLAGCDGDRIARLEPGVSTEAEVRAAFGEPAAVFDEAGGGRTFDYPRQPEGQVNYLITIGPDGKLSALRQVLAPRYFERVLPGLTQEQVRRILGRPAKVQTYELKQETVWDWYWVDGQLPRMFSVTFGPDGLVRAAGSVDDPRVTQKAY